MSKSKDMNNKVRSKKLVIPVVIVVSIIAVLAVVLIVYLAPRKSPNVKMVERLYSVIESEMYTEDIDNSAESDITIADKIYENMTLEVVDVQKTTCTVLVTAPDMNDLFFSVFHAENYDAATSMDEYEATVNTITEQIDTRLFENSYNHISTTVELPLDENGNPELTYEFVDAMYGGLLTLQQTLMDNYVAGNPENGTR